MELTDSVEVFAERVMGYDNKRVVQMMRTVQEPIARAILACRLMMLKTPDAVAAPTAALEKSKKALNAYMGYRCYYKNMPLFNTWPMKRISFYIGQMWEQEPDKPLWSLIAKAWSAIRDQVGKDNAPLDQFFDIVCTQLNILPPESYLQGRGWKVEYDSDGMPTLSHNPARSLAASFGYGYIGKTLSIEDITSVCLEKGYGIGYVSPKNSPLTFVEYNVQTMRSAARTKRRARRQTAREAPAAETLRKGYANFCGAIPQSALQDDRGDSKLYSHILDILSKYDVSAPNETAEAPIESLDGTINSVVAATACDGTDNNNFLVSTDMSAFRIGANADATLPSYDPNHF